jgi:HK97 family phage portal protein
MGFLTSLFGAPRAGGWAPTDERWFDPVHGPTWSGAAVTPDTAMRVATVYACVHFLSRVIAALPLHLYSHLATGGKQRESDHPLYVLLHDRPNDRQTAYEFWGMLVSHAALRGNAYALKQVGRGGNVEQLIPQHPDAVTVEQLRDGTVRYRIRLPDGTTRNYVADDLLHLRPFTDNGIMGRSPIDVHRETFGEALAAQQHAATFWRNAATPAGILTTDKTFTTESERQKARDSLRGTTTGLHKHETMMLDQGFKWTPVSVSQRDAQFIESRKFTKSEIASIFGLPPHVIGDLERSTNNNIEEQGIELVKFTLLSWAVMIEQTISRDLLLEPDKYFPKFLLDGLMRGATLARFQAYQSAIVTGYMTRNEAREMEDWNPIDGLDEPLQPLNTGAVGDHDARDVKLPAPLPDDAEEEDDKASASAPVPVTAPRAELIVREVALRTVQRERHAITELAAKHGGDTAKWLSACEEYYARRAAHVAKALQLHPAAVEAYTTQQLASLHAGGVAATTEWETTAAPRLADLALIGGN